MKVTVIGPVFPYRGGIAQFATSLAAELPAAGHEVQVISFARQYPRWLYPGQSDKDPSQQHEQVTARFILDPLYPMDVAERGAPGWRFPARPGCFPVVGYLLVTGLCLYHRGPAPPEDQLRCHDP
jgi:hypothetical protein